MKKSISIVLAIMVVLALLLVNAPHQAQAKQMKTETPVPNTLIADGSWNTGTNLDVSVKAASAPTWLQLLADGVKVAEAGKICHPLRGGQFGWVGQIMQYIDGKWVKLATTNDWVPNKEGVFMSCAQAPAAGTYALFGYWIKPAGYVESVDAPTCSTAEWTFYYGNSDFDQFYNIVAENLDLPDGTVLTFTFVSKDPGVIVQNLVETAIVSGGKAEFSDTLEFTIGTLTFKLSAPGCERTFSMGMA
jgi:hypothetical protein